MHVSQLSVQPRTCLKENYMFSRKGFQAGSLETQGYTRMDANGRRTVQVRVMWIFMYGTLLRESSTDLDFVTSIRSLAPL